MIRSKPAAPRGAFGLGALIAVGVVVYLLLAGDDIEAEYRSAVARFGQEPIERLVTATLPPAMAAHCISNYGDDPAMVEAVIAYDERMQAAQQALFAELDTSGTMTAGERRAVEAVAVERAATTLTDRAACEGAVQRIDAGEFDL